MSTNSLFAPTTGVSASPASSTVSSASSPNSTNAANSNSLISETSFMNLLVKELQNQNPSSPMSNSDFISELAQFNSMNSLSTMNTSLQSLVSTMNQSAMGNAVNMIGKTVQASGDSTFNFTSGSPASLDYSLPQNASSVALDIYNSSGNMVYNTNLGNQSSGGQTFSWDGTTNSGSSAPAGSYTFSVSGTGPSGTAVTGTTFTGATVSGLTTSSSGAVELELSNGSTVPLSSVTSVN